MKNEKLFEKIRHTALTQTSGIEEYNPDKIWLDVKRKERRNMLWLWWPYAAASVVLLIGLSLWYLNDQHHNSPIVIRSGIQNPLGGFSKGNTENVQRNSISKPSGPFKKIEHQTRATNKRSAQEQPKQIMTINESFTAVNDLNILEPAMNIAPAIDTSNIRESVLPKVEKVLIAEISIPEEKIAESSALLQILDQVKKERQARKMRLQFDRHIGKPSALWSFVHHSLVEYPSGVIPIQPQKSADTLR